MNFEKIKIEPTEYTYRDEKRNVYQLRYFYDGQEVVENPLFIITHNNKDINVYPPMSSKRGTDGWFSINGFVVRNEDRYDFVDGWLQEDIKNSYWDMSDKWDSQFPSPLY